jgi:hypothetical protein
MLNGPKETGDFPWWDDYHLEVVLGQYPAKANEGGADKATRLKSSLHNNTFNSYVIGSSQPLHPAAEHQHPGQKNSDL